MDRKAVNPAACLVVFSGCLYGQRMESMYVTLREASQALGISAEQLYRMGVADQLRIYKPQPFHKKAGDGYEIVESLIFDFDKELVDEVDEDPENLYYFKLYGELLLIRKADFQKMLDRLPSPKMVGKPGGQISPAAMDDDSEPPLIGMVDIKEWFAPISWNTIKDWIESEGSKPERGKAWTLSKRLAREIYAKNKKLIELKRKNEKKRKK